MPYRQSEADAYGIGGFGVQIAAALGAAVVAIDIDRERLDLAARHGSSLTLDAMPVLPENTANTCDSSTTWSLPYCNVTSQWYAASTG